MTGDVDLEQFLSDPEVRAALKHIGRTSADLCPRCAKRQLASGRDLCAGCIAELDEAELAKKRRSYHKSATTTSPPTKRDACRRWLRAQFHGRPVPSAAIRAKARKAGFSARTLRRAASDLGITYDRHGDGTTSWTLPPKAERHDDD